MSSDGLEFGEELSEEELMEESEMEEELPEEELIEQTEMDEIREELRAEIEELRRESQEFKKLTPEERRNMEFYDQVSDEEDENYDPNEEDEESDCDAEDEESNDGEETETLDRISGLPDSLIVRILSCLPTTEDVIRTCVISKRWEFLWTFVPKLSFTSDGNPLRTADFVTLVNQTLLQCSCSKLDQFSVKLEYEPRFAPQINIWIRYALIRHVGELVIDLVCDDQATRPKVPEYIFTNPVLASLCLKSCRFLPNSTINWKSLMKLSIWCSELREDVIENIMVGSCVLEVLELGSCYGFQRLDISSPTVRKLVLCGYNDGGNETVEWVEINAPNVVSLEILGRLRCGNLMLIDGKSLVEAKIEFAADHQSEKDILKGLLQKLAHVDEVKVGDHLLRVLMSLEMEGWSSPISTCKCLQVNFTKRDGFQGMANLLKSSPGFESVHISSNPPFLFTDDNVSLCIQNDLLSPKLSFHSLLQSLKTLKIAYSVECGSEVIQFVLKNASALEKMVVCVSSE